MSPKPPVSNDKAPPIHQKSFTLEATLDDGESDQVLVDTTRVNQSALDGAMGDSAFFSYRLKNGGHINATKLTPSEDMTVTGKNEDDSNVIIAQIALTGQAIVSYLTPEEHPVSQTQGCLYRYTGGTAKYQLRGGETTHTCSVSLYPEVLMRYLDDDVPDALRPLFGADADTPTFIPFSVSQAMHAVMKNGLNSPLEDSLQQMHMEGVALQYIALIADALSKNGEYGDVNLQKSDLKSAHQVYEELKAVLRQPPCMSELSETAGMSERRLNRAFRELYGGTVFETLRNIRLEEARIMLEQTDMAIKTIAWEVGYEHSSNFTNAFSAQFGTTPGAYAKPFRKTSI